ncbi:MAG: hypothetical protein EBU52_05605 [Cytophagia bacterium]|nr:hypothetical protein [Cytophagia bacterium]
MESVKEVVEFSIVKVITEQFAIIEKAFAETEEINLNTNLRFAIDRDERVVVVYVLFKFEQKDIPFLMVEVSCRFLISSKSWSAFIKDDVNTVIPKEFLTHLGMITVGTARGVLHTKTEGTGFNDFILPTINVVDMVKDDVSFKETVSG